jgi:putative transposase
MDNHVHLLVETPEPNLSSGMQRLHGHYARSFNERHGRCGHVFQGRFGSVLVRTQPQFWTVVSYIVRNPVEAGFCERPELWRWSSHAATLDSGTAPPWLSVSGLLRYFDGVGDRPRRRYAELTARP